jgi:hypothetical protein
MQTITPLRPSHLVNRYGLPLPLPNTNQLSTWPLRYPMSQGSSSPTRNRKTFSGCWSCRERKIKCDEAKPTCRQCMKSRLECKGYGLRLQWIINKQADAEFPGVSNPRRNIALGTPRRIPCLTIITLTPALSRCPYASAFIRQN